MGNILVTWTPSKNLVFYLVFSWYLLGIYQVFTWYSLGIYLVLTWYQLGINLVFPNTKLGIFLVFFSLTWYFFCWLGISLGILTLIFYMKSMISKLKFRSFWLFSNRNHLSFILYDENVHLIMSLKLSASIRSYTRLSNIQRLYVHGRAISIRKYSDCDYHYNLKWEQSLILELAAVSVDRCDL